MDAEPAVDHATQILRLHGAGAAGVMAPGVVRDMLLQLIVGEEMAAGRLLFGDQIADRVGHLAPESDSGDDRVEIVGWAQLPSLKIMEVDRRVDPVRRWTADRTVPAVFWVYAFRTTQVR